MHKYNRKIVVLVIVAMILLVIAIWGPEKLATFQDKKTLNHVTAEAVENASEGYRYSLSNNEKMYLLSKCLNNQVIAESKMSAFTKADDTDNVNYSELMGTYAFVVNHRGPSDQQIKDDELYEICNEELDELKTLGILPDTVKRVKTTAYDAVLYSAIDVLEPRNNLSVWKISLSTNYQNANKKNRLLDAYIDADTGKIYEFYVRIEDSWDEIEPDKMLEKWSNYMGLEDYEEYKDSNPLMETTPNFKKYNFPGMDGDNTIVTIGFYEGINELFLKISR